MDKTSQKYDLEDRTIKFGEGVILLCRKIKVDFINRSIVDQLIRSATSVGANYSEANGASSKKDFRNKIYLCKKESQEARYWLRMLSVASPSFKQELLAYRQEAHEFVLIFHKIGSSLSN